MKFIELNIGAKVLWRGEPGMVVWVQTPGMAMRYMRGEDSPGARMRADRDQIGAARCVSASGREVTIDEDQPRVLVRLDKRGRFSPKSYGMGRGPVVRYAWALPRVLSLWVDRDPLMEDLDLREEGR